VRLTKPGVRSLSLAAGIALLLNATWQPAWAADALYWTLPQLGVSGQPPPQGAAAVAPVVDANAVSNFIAAWQARAEQVRANQPAWSSPLITTTGMLEQRFRFDASEQHAGNGADTTVLDGGRAWT
jgi:hypothetical protein